jgi:DUF2075 family protein
MIVYQSTKREFHIDILSGDIENIILQKFQEKLKRRTSLNEIGAWKDSLHYMNTVLSDSEIPSNIGISIECQIPQTSKRIDFIISGKNGNKKEYAIIIELKRWQTAQVTEKDGIIRTPLGKGFHETNHPSYQAWSYAALLQDFNETIYKDDIQLKPCAYLHNYDEDEIIRDSFYKEYIDRAPLFLKKDIFKLQAFIKEFVKYGDDGKLLYRIDQGKIKPSKSLADSLAKMLLNNNEFIMIDEQKLVYETALALTKKSTEKNKNVLIVEGGPGTGKSIVAINLLVEITKREKLVHYVTKNAAPRDVYEKKLTGIVTRGRFTNMFKSSGAYTETAPNSLDALIIDEAHRLNEKSGMYRHLGENQVKEIIRSSKCSVFFLDENQKVTIHDVGTKDEIKKWAKHFGCNVQELELSSQFRCNGSDGFLSWLDNILQIRETANYDASDLDFDFRVIDTPNELRDLIFEKNKERNKARMVAGYCWDWKSKKDNKVMDIIMPEHNFEMQWNLKIDGPKWIIQPNSVSQVGCIHTCQGLEVDYIGVIVGLDLIIRNREVITDVSKRSKMDASIKGFKSLLKYDKQKAEKEISVIIKNTYRTLMTRGMKGCYVYFTDEETRTYFKNLMV